MAPASLQGVIKFFLNLFGPLLQKYAPSYVLALKTDEQTQEKE